MHSSYDKVSDVKGSLTPMQESNNENTTPRVSSAYGHEEKALQKQSSAPSIGEDNQRSQDDLGTSATIDAQERPPVPHADQSRSTKLTLNLKGKDVSELCYQVGKFF